MTSVSQYIYFFLNEEFLGKLWCLRLSQCPQATAEEVRLCCCLFMYSMVISHDSSQQGGERRSEERHFHPSRPAV